MKKQSAYVFLPVTVSMLAAFGAVALATGSASTAAPACNPALVYCPNEIQDRVDRSFSDIRIDTWLDSAKNQLTEISTDCFPGECDWRNRLGVRHYFFGDQLVVKSVRADEFVGQPIDALGIGYARDREEVISKATAFLGGVALDCHPVNSSGRGCLAYLNPGWVWISFDSNDRLKDVQFDGYHFT